MISLLTGLKPFLPPCKLFQMSRKSMEKITETMGEFAVRDGIFACWSSRFAQGKDKKNRH